MSLDTTKGDFTPSRILDLHRSKATLPDGSQPAVANVTIVHSPVAPTLSPRSSTENVTWVDPDSDALDAPENGPLNGLNDQPQPENKSGEQSLSELTADDRFNFKCLGLYQIVLRTGWIFKTESIIMPAILDVIGGAGWLRGCLPMLNRFGQSIPPLLASDHVRNSNFKKIGLAGSTAVMGACFLVLSLLWALTGGAKSSWLPYAFLVIYGIFFGATGVNQLQLVTITGKLIRVDYRGRVGMVAVLIGSIVACILAWLLLSKWLPSAPGTVGNFTAIFFFTGATFMLASLIALGFREKEDVETYQRRGGMELFRSSISTIKNDRNFLRLTLIGGLFGMCLTLFPHYQSLARERLSLGLSSLIPWVIAQNMGAAVFSIPAGWLADRLGNRIVLQFIMFILCIPPILAIVASNMTTGGELWFNVVFFLVGLTPVTFRVLFNYTLEVTENSEHPRYLSTLGLIMAVPAILTSSFFGALVDWISFEFVFAIVVLCLLLGWVLTFTLTEPRKKVLVVN